MAATQPPRLLQLQQSADQTLVAAWQAAPRQLVFHLPPELAVPAAALADAMAGEPAVIFHDREGRSEAGLGATDVLITNGANRFRELLARAQGPGPATAQHISLEDGQVETRPAVPTRWLGGFAFHENSHALASPTSPWRHHPDAWFMQPRWHYARTPQGATLTLRLDATARLETLRTELRELLHALAQPHAQPGQLPSIVAPPPTTEHAEAKRAWQARLAAVADLVAQGHAHKLVPARATHRELSHPASLRATLHAILANQPNCYAIAIRVNAQAPTLVAAPPERLVAMRHGEVYSEAMAGSAPNCGQPDEPAALVADEKNRREHQWVIDAITATFARHAIIPMAPPTTSVRTLRNIHHLHTPLSGTAPAHLHILDVVAALHPTPAVGGTPREVAQAWLRQTEPDRGWYAAPLGWFDASGNGEFAVGIRCALFDNTSATLWAGAGVVAGSDATLEYEETEVKLRAMEQALAAAPAPWPAATSTARLASATRLET